MSDTSVKAETAPPPRLDALPAELLVRVLKNLEPEALSSCHGLNKLIHGPPSIVKQALRDIASDQGLSVPETLPSGCADWTQALLFLAVLRREGGRSRLAATGAHSAIIDPSGTLFICGYDCAAPAPALLGRGNPKDLNQSIPRPMPGLENVRVRAVAAACRSIIALSVEGTLFSWGDGSDCVLGHGDRNHVLRSRERSQDYATRAAFRPHFITHSPSPQTARCRAGEKMLFCRATSAMALRELLTSAMASRELSSCCLGGLKLSQAGTCARWQREVTTRSQCVHEKANASPGAAGSRGRYCRCRSVSSSASA